MISHAKALLLAAIVALFCFDAASAETTQSAFLTPPRVIANPGPEYSGAARKFQGIPSLAIAPKGRLWAIWYAGITPGEDKNNYVALATSGDDGKTWKEALAIDPDGSGPARAFDPELWLDPDGRVWAFWAQAAGHEATQGGVWSIMTANPDVENASWSAPRRLTDGVMMDKPLVLSSGEWVLPASTWRKTDNSARMIVSSDHGQTWALRGACDVPVKARAFDEHAIVERKDKSLWMLVRTNYGIGESVSKDRGKTWSALTPSAIPHPSARFFIMRLRSGKLLLVKHGPLDKAIGRSHLTAFLSEDDGKTWGGGHSGPGGLGGQTDPGKLAAQDGRAEQGKQATANGQAGHGGLLLDERSGVSYPDGQQGSDGVIRVIYDYSRTRDKEILMAKFTEEDIAQGKLVTPSSALRIIVNKAAGAAQSASLSTSDWSDPSDASDPSDRPSQSARSTASTLSTASTSADATTAPIPIPPSEHPRLYLRAPQVAQLSARLKDPVLLPVVERLRSQAAKSAQSKIEWDALQYLVSKDRALGRSVIESALALMKKTVLEQRQDACRATGRMMVTGAMAYDWVYALLTREEKKAFIAEFIRLAKTQECGYPPTKQGSVTGHASEAMIMRDMVSAGIAIYDEFPEMYDVAAGRFFRDHLPARNWFYNGHAYHQGDSYGCHRYSWDTYPLYIFDRLGAGGVYNREQQYVPYLWIYTTRPDGQRMRAGDTFAHSAPRGTPWSGYMGTLLTANYYSDGYLLDQFQRQGGRSDEAMFEFLWRDTALQAKSIATLPLSRFFESPFGWMVARTGWDADSVIAEMKINEYNFANHQHMDAGAFQIYYKGSLAIDSGLYSGSSGAYGSPHCMNYYWRTIAHNSLLVYDPDEKFGREGYGNDGGQRLPNNRSEPKTLAAFEVPDSGYCTGKTLAHGFGPDPKSPDFTLLQGDITQAYSKKVKQVTRSWVFLNLRSKQTPAAMIVFDRIVTANPAFKPYWLLHSLEEPRVDGGAAVVDCTQHGAEGRLTLDALLPPPVNLSLEKIGGRGKEFWVFGKNYENDVDPKMAERGTPEPGAWRIEASPKNAATENLFLNVMQVSNRTSVARLPVRKLEADERVGCALEGPEATWTVLFRRDAARSDKAVRFTLAGKSTCRALIADLAPGKWQARCEGDAAAVDVQVTEECGAVWIDGKAGEWTLSL